MTDATDLLNTLDIMHEDEAIANAAWNQLWYLLFGAQAVESTAVAQDRFERTLSAKMHLREGASVTFYLDITRTQQKLSWSFFLREGKHIESIGTKGYPLYLNRAKRTNHARYILEEIIQQLVIGPKQMKSVYYKNQYRLTGDYHKDFDTHVVYHPRDSSSTFLDGNFGDNELNSAYVKRVKQVSAARRLIGLSKVEYMHGKIDEGTDFFPNLSGAFLTDVWQDDQDEYDAT